MLIAVMIAAQTALGASAPPTARAAITRALPALERSAKSFVAQRGCVSCHHNILPILTLRLAASRGFRIDDAVLNDVERKTFRELTQPRAIGDAIQGVAASDPTPNDSWLLVAAQVSGLQSPASAIVARRIASWQHDGHWTTSDFRAPHSSSLFTSTATAVRAIRTYLPDGVRAERERVIADAIAWMTRTPAASTEDATFKLLGLVWGGAARDSVLNAAQNLQQLQRSAGGWAQLPDYAPDAYSTGEALYALHEAGLSSDSTWRRGIAFLLKTQSADGTWHVRTRMLSPAEVSPPYFTTGFPYKKDEYISYAASSWATMALVASLPVKDERVAFDDDPRNRYAVWGEKAFWGTASDLRALLDGGLSADATQGDVSLLMMAVPDVEKVSLLLSRGANVKYRAPSGYDALTVAASYRGSSVAMKLLLDAGADAEPPDGVKVKNSPLLLASMSGDIDAVTLLLSRGAKPNPRPNASGSSPLAEAITFGRADVVRALISAGAKVDLVERTGVNLLHWATITNRAELIPQLSKAGVDINAIDEHGYTPLMYAATIDFGDTATLEALLAAGADRSILNEQGRTARAQALYLKHARLAQALR